MVEQPRITAVCAPRWEFDSDITVHYRRRTPNAEGYIFIEDVRHPEDVPAELDFMRVEAELGAAAVETDFAADGGDDAEEGEAALG